MAPRLDGTPERVSARSDGGVCFASAVMEPRKVTGWGDGARMMVAGENHVATDFEPFPQSFDYQPLPCGQVENLVALIREKCVLEVFLNPVSQPPVIVQNDKCAEDDAIE